MDDPIQEEYRQFMGALASGIDKILNGDGPPKLAFVLLVCEFGDGEEGRVNYISNAERADTISMMKEYIARQEKSQ